LREIIWCDNWKRRDRGKELEMKDGDNVFSEEGWNVRRKGKGME
jgi:hypothetical protein